MMPLCVYALTTAPALRLDALRGLAGERLRGIRAGGVTAIVGTIRRVPSPDEASLRRFDRIVRRLFEDVAALLPARFATSFDSADELALVLRARQASLRRALRLVRNRAQMIVRVPGAGVGKNGAGTSFPEASSGKLAPAPFSAPASGTDYLRARAAAAARDREVAGFEPVRARVRRWIRAERVEHRSGVASLYHLIPRSAASSYATAVQQAATATGLQCIVTGPWPPYAFIEW